MAARKKTEQGGVYADILKVTGLGKNKGESFIKYVERIGTHISTLPDEEFTKLAPETQEWYDKSVEAVNANKPDSIPALSDWPEDSDAPNTESDQPPAPAKSKSKKASAPTTAALAAAKTDAVDKKEQDVATSKKKPMKKKAAGKAASTGAAPKKAATKKTADGNGAARAARTEGTSYKIRLAVIKNPEITFEAAASKAGIAKPEVGSHAHNMWNHARIICAMQKELGL